MKPMIRNVLVVVIAALLAGGCAGGGKERGAGPLRVTCTIGMIGDCARIIGGEHVAA